MAAKVAFEKATEAHAMAMAASLNPEDALECQAFGYETGLDALLASVRASRTAFAGMVDGEVGCMFGVCLVKETVLGASDMGVIWFLTGEAFRRHPLAFAREARWVMRSLLDGHRALGNFIDARYPAAVRWAKWLGFTVGEAEPIGPNRAMVHPAYIRRT